jgi:hypothetical protein
MTPSEIAQHLIGLGRELDGLVKEYRQIGETAAEAKRVYEVAEARAYLNAAGPVEERKRIAVEQTADFRFALDVAERRVAGCREAIRAVHARIEIGRTLSATTRDEMKLAGVAT